MANSTLPVSNPYTAETQEKIARLRALAAEIPDDVNGKPPTPAQLALVTKTSAEFLEKAAGFADAVPSVASALGVDAAVLRDAISFELAYRGLVDECAVLMRHAVNAIARHKLGAVRLARTLYHVSKGYVQTDPGDAVKPHVVEMKRTLNRKTRKSANSTPPAPTPSTV